MNAFTLLSLAGLIASPAGAQFKPLDVEKNPGGVKVARCFTEC